MDLSTKYLGLKLRSPLVISASPMSEDIDNVKRMEDAGAAAVVLYSLFEEQLRQDRLELNQNLQQGTDSFAEALTYFPEPDDFRLGPEEYLKHIAAAKKAGFEFVASSEVNANPRDTKDWVDGVWTLPPTLSQKDKDRAKYIAVGEADNYVLKFRKPQ